MLYVVRAQQKSRNLTYNVYSLNCKCQATSFGFLSHHQALVVRGLKMKQSKCCMRQITSYTFQLREWDPILQSRLMFSFCISFQCY
jgi:hypothetical protein